MGACGMFKNAIIVAFLSWGGYYCYNLGMPNWWHESKLPDTVEALDVGDTVRLKHVLFSGEPWLLQCYSGLPFPGQHLPAPFRLHPTFVESLDSMKGVLKGGTLDCEKALPTNKTIIAKFGLTRRTQPLLLYAGGGDRPHQVPSASASSAYGVTAWVKPKAEPRVRVAKSQKALDSYCGGRRACLLTKLASDSPVLEQLAARHRTIEVVSIGDGAISWGRGEEVGETLEEDEAKHFGQRTSILRADPEAPRPTRKGARPAPRLLRGHTGEEDLPSLSLFIERTLAANPDEPLMNPDGTDGGKSFVKAELPKLSAPPKPKKAKESKTDAERQAKRAQKRAENQRKEEAKRKEEAAAREEAAKGRTAAQQQEAERRRREQMAAEEDAAANILEEVDDDDDDEGDDDDVEEVDDFDEEDDGTDVLDLDA